MTTTSALPNSSDITRIVLSNGMCLLVRENHAAPVVVVDGYIPTGSIHDPQGREGLSSFVASMLTRGSEHYTFDQFNEATEGVGASLSVAGDEHFTSYGITSLSEDSPKMLHILADILRRPTFPAEHVQRVRNQKLVYIQDRDQDTHQLAHLRFYESLYGDHPYGRANSGYQPSISAVERLDLETFHAQHYTPDGAILVVVGDVQTEAVIEQVQALFGDWTGPASDQTVPEVIAPAKLRKVHCPLPGKVQSDIVIGAMAVARHHPDFDAIRVANTILGRFGMMGRLGENIRERQGLAYYAYSSQDAGPLTGTWLASAGVNPANVQVAVDSIINEFSRLGTEPVSEEELDDSQAYLTGVLPLTLATNEGVAATLLNMEWYRLGLDYLLHYRDNIYKITSSDVQRVAARYLNSGNYSLVIAGPNLDAQ
jgi:zinc protease